MPVPGIDGTALRNFMDNAGQGIGGMLSMFTGGAIKRMGIFALGIMPYISASIIIQLLASMIPALEQMKKEGDAGRKKMNQWTRYGTVCSGRPARFWHRQIHRSGRTWPIRPACISWFPA